MAVASNRNVPAQWLPFLGPKLGLAKALYDLAIDPDDFDVHHVFPALTKIDRLLCHEHDLDPRAGGAGVSLEEATNRTMGELLERYAFFAYDGPADRALSYQELVERGDSLPPFEFFSLFSNEQTRSHNFPYAPFSTSAKTAWVRGTNLLDGRLVMVPGQIVSLNYFHAADETPYFYPTSSGCAVARTVEEAALKGLLELIERDAVMIRWYARLPPPALPFDAPELPHSALRQCRHLEVRFLDLTVDGEVSVVGVACIERTGRPCFLIFSAASALDPAAAARKALIEAAQGRPFIKSLSASLEAPAPDALFADFESNLRFYAEPSNARYFEWFLQNEQMSSRAFNSAPPPTEPLTLLADLLERCARMNVTPIAFDITTPEMRDCGFFACRIVAPELVPLCVPSAPFLGHPRLSAYSVSASKSAIPAWIPHPFP
jgi:ribosomal protein S12 methylthiotransferase accessory factor